jgi:PII-like signaling protein
MERAATLGIVGGSVFAGFCSFGRGHHLHEPHMFHASDETPLTVIIVDDRDAINDLLRAMRTLLPHAFAVADEVTVIRYKRDQATDQHKHRWFR